VELVTSAGRVLRLVSFLAVLGFLTVILVGPVLALVIGVLSLIVGLLITVLPFAVIGLLVWGAYAAVTTRDRRAAWQRLGRRAASVWRWLVTAPLAACGRLCAWGVGVGRTLAPLAVPAARRAGEVARDGVEVSVALAERGACQARSAARRVGGVLLEMVGGAAVGTILVCLADKSQHGRELVLSIAAGAVAGAFVGLIVGAAHGSARAERG
jgi:hypothetical protein